MTKPLADLEVPGPTVTPLTQPFWDAAEDGRLILQYCGVCERAVFYPRALCPHCWSDALNWQEASGQGRLKSFSEIWKPGHPGWIPVTPYIVGLVELTEGPTMLSYIQGDTSQVAVGDPLVFAATKIGSRVLPCFKTVDN